MESQKCQLKRSSLSQTTLGPMQFNLLALICACSTKFNPRSYQTMACQSQPLFFKSQFLFLHNSLTTIYQDVIKMVCWRFEPTATEWEAQMNPLGHGHFARTLLELIEKRMSCKVSFYLIDSKIHLGQRIAHCRGKDHCTTRSPVRPDWI